MNWIDNSMAMLQRRSTRSASAPVKDKRLAAGRKRILFLVRAWTCMSTLNYLSFFN
jgi:hypothetical protein